MKGLHVVMQSGGPDAFAVAFVTTASPSVAGFLDSILCHDIHNANGIIN